MSQIEITNPMQHPRIRKVVVNISIGESGEKLQNAMTVLNRLTNHQPNQRLAKKAVREWGTRKGEPIACAVTLRGEDAIDFLKRSLEAVRNRLPKSSFDNFGNVSYGIKEHIEIPGVRYDPALGIFGMDVCIALEKPGYRVKMRRIRKSRIGKAQRITSDDAANYMKETFGTEIWEEG